jgi:hypothetical protein
VLGEVVRIKWSRGRQSFYFINLHIYNIYKFIYVKKTMHLIKIKKNKNGELRNPNRGKTFIR